MVAKKIPSAAGAIFGLFSYQNRLKTLKTVQNSRFLALDIPLRQIFLAKPENCFCRPLVVHVRAMMLISSLFMQRKIRGWLSYLRGTSWERLDGDAFYIH